MSAISRSRFRGLCLIATLVALFVIAPAAQAAKPSGPIFKDPTAGNGTYLALGDSLAFGYQGVRLAGCWQTGCQTPNATNNTGYVDGFANAFSGEFTGVETVNLGCPGETSDSLINDTNGTTGCTKYPFALHTNHPGKTQLQAALNYLGDGKTNPVTINIGANDVLALVRVCGGYSTPTQLFCIQSGAPATIATIQANLDAALKKIRAASNSEIIVMGLYNPLYVAVLGSPTSVSPPFWSADKIGAARATDNLVNLLNSNEREAAEKYRAIFVDPMPSFNPNYGDTGYGPYGEVQAVCAQTLMCVDQTVAPVDPVPFPTLPVSPATGDGIPDGDIHASDAGYAALGDLIHAASGY